jgi:hypothetical protein
MIQSSTLKMEAAGSSTVLLPTYQTSMCHISEHSILNFVGALCFFLNSKHNAHVPQDYWVFWTFPSSGILETREHDVSETGSVSVLR